MKDNMAWKVWEGGRHKAKSPALILRFVQPQGPKETHEGAFSGARRKVKAKQMGLLATVPALLPHSTSSLEISPKTWFESKGKEILCFKSQKNYCYAYVNSLSFLN